ncbi:hypothetical protein MUK42_16085 [Musa troglodytarum]|uniref:Uncharacterized protein n=1 Tax=Musa troglodytarum TaxID=320322 RepID=A0A9E7HJE7_9LILI|nr:hypothetical protein MUK42_16085 [Musa troglodytarum]URE31172.1 hypothetical protein MUK42_16085 [Musa troglodytarum]URE31173.1 hypothetical protein MUK42_16085 [Musa troglodytarum]URE31174.1 hypothetical protein MUK42_16085 [Musa troglodytarum]URE31179.1 hypothetical protein MUK42_16085 [Musa troglodytarum]
MIPLYFSSAQTTATVDDRESRLNCFDEVATGDGLMRALLYVTDNSPLKPGGLHLSPRTGASLSIHALAAAPLGLALRKEIALLLVAAEKIPWLGAIDVSEGDSVAREGFEDREDRGICVGSSSIGVKRVIMSPYMPRRSDLSMTPVDHEFLRRGKEPVATWNLVDGLHGREEMSEEKGRTEER